MFGMSFLHGRQAGQGRQGIWSHERTRERANEQTNGPWLLLNLRRVDRQVLEVVGLSMLDAVLAG